MTDQELKGVDDTGIEKLWNELAECFEAIKTDRPRSVVVGFFQLSRETERRGLKLSKGNLGDTIILIPNKIEQHGTTKKPFAGSGKRNH